MNSPIGLKRYLGDSVYADFDGSMIVLTTDNGYGPSNTIYMEPEVYEALTKYAASLWPPLIQESE